MYKRQTILSVFRKILSIIVLERIRDKVDNYLSPSQAGFRPNRSTGDIVYAHKWLIARVPKHRESYTILGIDMSSAFDTILRLKLLEILKDIVNNDELKIIRLLLAETSLNITCDQKTTEVPTIIGTPQGDSLSPILFIVYLEAALRELRPLISPSNLIHPNELVYADDCDIIFDNKAEATASVPIIVNCLQKWNLQVNAGKTEFTVVSLSLIHI